MAESVTIPNTMTVLSSVLSLSSRATEYMHLYIEIFVLERLGRVWTYPEYSDGTKTLTKVCV